MQIREAIEKQLKQNRIVLYMKGTPDFPQCGFSGKAVYLLRECEADFYAVNVLDDDEIRQGIKDFGNWPTIPQLYVDGQLIGGSDIMLSLFESGELAKIVGTQTA